MATMGTLAAIAATGATYSNRLPWRGQWSGGAGQGGPPRLRTPRPCRGGPAGRRRGPRRARPGGKAPREGPARDLRL
eukprot:11226181-Lingulodinium_polyedra.AAC.1